MLMREPKFCGGFLGKWVGIFRIDLTKMEFFIGFFHDFSPIPATETRSDRKGVLPVQTFVHLRHWRSVSGTIRTRSASLHYIREERKSFFDFFE